MNNTKETLTDVKNALKGTPAGQSEPLEVKQTPVASAQIKTEPANPKDIVSNLTDDSIENLLQFPYTILRFTTNFDGFKVNELIIDDLVKMGKQMAKDFGVDTVNRWMNASMFIALYTTNAFTCFADYSESKKGRKILYVKKEDNKNKDPKENTPKKDKDQPGFVPY